MNTAATITLVLASAKDGLYRLPRTVTHLRGQKYAVSPCDQVGTCGFWPVPWNVQYVIARTPEDALKKSYQYLITEQRARELGIPIPDEAVEI